LTTAAGAHDVLKSIYRDPDAPQGNRIKAASAALPHDTPKLMPEKANLDLVAEPVETLFEQADRRMRKQLPLQGQQIKVIDGEVIVLRPGNGGNGQDD
jgi:hypothetical protein